MKVYLFPFPVNEVKHYESRDPVYEA